MSFNAPIKPSNCSLSRLLKSFRVVMSRIHDIIKLHHDIRADRSLEKIS